MDIIRVKFLDDRAHLPTRGSEYAAGWDLYASHHFIIPAGHRCLINTGISIAIPPGTYGRIAPRSGLAVKNGIDVLAGVVDQDYRGEVKVALLNTDKNQTFSIRAGDRIAQLIVEKYCVCDIERSEDLTLTVRGIGGFGSTGS